MSRVHVWIVAALLSAGIAVIGSPVPGAVAEESSTDIAVASLSAGDATTCAILDIGSVKCWGSNARGRLGLGDTVNRGDAPGEMGSSLPTVDLGAGRTATQLALGASFACVVLDDGTVKCWGRGDDGALGQGDTDSRGDGPGEMGDALPAVDLGDGTVVTMLTAGIGHVCALAVDGSVRCWGGNSDGRLGLGDTSPRGDGPGEMGDGLPTIDLGAGRTATSIDAGAAHTCALLNDGSVKCWGSNSAGQLGLGDTSPRGDGPGEMGDGLPAIDLGAGRTATAIDGGLLHTCAVLDDGSVKCWGFNSQAELGLGDTSNRGDGPGEMGDALPTVDLGAGQTATSVLAGNSMTCAQLTNGAVKCWGSESRGRLGSGNSSNTIGDASGEMGDALATVDFGTGRRALAVAVSSNFHACALLDDGTVKCWGGATSGALGSGDTIGRGDNPGEMGDALPRVDLGRLVGRAVVGGTMTADRRAAVSGSTVTYTVTLRNRGTVPLTGIRVDAALDVCDRRVARIPTGDSVQYSCAVTVSSNTPVVANLALVTTTQGAVALSSVVSTRVDARVLRADGSVRVGSGAFLGNDIVNSTAASQSVATRTGSRAVRFTWRIQNDGNVADSFRLRGPGGTKKFAVVYRSGTTNVTAAVRAGTFTTASLAPSASSVVTMTVTPKARARSGDSFTANLVASSVAKSTAVDTVRVTTTRR